MDGQVDAEYLSCLIADVAIAVAEVGVDVDVLLSSNIYTGKLA